MLTDRELSWLAFNERVLQEAEDESVPLLERLFFGGVFSSNLDEFFRVRVASLRSLLRAGPRLTEGLDVSPHRLLHDIHRTAVRHIDRYGDVQAQLKQALHREGIHIVDECSVPIHCHDYLREYFLETVREHLVPMRLTESGTESLFMHNGVPYLVVELWAREPGAVVDWAPDYALVQVPSPPLPRFVTLPENGADRYVMFLDDVIRYNLPILFPGCDVGRAFAVMLTRDADLHVEDEFTGDLERAIRASLGNREKGVPSRFLYDTRAPYVLVHRLQHRLGLSEEDVVPGGRYNRLSDYMGFPRFDRTDLTFPAWSAVPHPVLDGADSILSEIARGDQLIHTPYQSFDSVIRFLEEGAADPAVESLALTVYRVARESRVLTALESAAKAGKEVTVFFEVQARFDEESNLAWADRLRAGGVRVLSSIVGLKVHAKLALIRRREEGVRRHYAYVGTGNFNEKTAGIYADHGLFTADPRITGDVAEVFRFLTGEVEKPEVRHLLVAPFALRSSLERLMHEEVVHAREGRPAGITLKLNALEDAKIIRRLSQAAADGVPVRAVIRGICRLPEDAETGGRFQVRSIVDRYLEHARVYHFEAGGDERMYLASADWMSRNLNRRVEVAVPIFDPVLRDQLRRMLELQFADDTKARIVDRAASNRYAREDGNGTVRAQTVRAQAEFRDFVRGLMRPPRAG